ncbi:ATP-dependent Clp protease proteolytic subunit 1 [Thalassocella blandensis]|nr:ATP-dependent Clp protease proteolytic subunit 1 [Thalassocella blandensis]
MRKLLQALGKQDIQISPTATINKKGELLLYGVIGDWWDGLDAYTIVRELDELDGDEIVLRFHSPGGVILDGLAMYNALKASKKRIVGYIDGIAASMAASVAMACDQLFIPTNAMIMIHKPNYSLCGTFNAVDFQKLAESLNNYEPTVLQLLSDKTGKPIDEIRALLSDGEDHFYRGQEAIDFGLADELIDYVDAGAIMQPSQAQAVNDPFKTGVVMDISNNNATSQYFPSQSASQARTWRLAGGEPLPQATLKTISEFLQTAAAAVSIKPQEKPMKIKSKSGAPLAALVTAALVAQYANVDAAVTALAEHGFSKELLSGEAEASLSDLGKLADVLKVEMPAAPQATQPAAAAQPAAAQGNDLVLAERKRAATLRTIGAQASIDDATIQQWIDNDVSVDAARETALAAMADRNNAQLPQGNHVRASGQVNIATAVSQALLVRTSPDNYKHNDNSREFTGLSLMEIAKAVLQSQGVSIERKSKMEVAGLAMHTTSDFPLVLADVANKELLRAYRKKAKTYQKISRRSTSTDFKEKHSVEIGSGSELAPVNQKGEFKHGTLSEAGYGYKLESFGRIFAFTRQLLINDNLGAMTNFIAQLGSKAHSLEEKIVWELIKSNPNLKDGNPLFSSTASHKRGNLITDATIAAALNSAMVKMAAQKDLDGEEIDIQPSILAIPYARYEEAMKALSAVLATTTGEVNVFANSLEALPVTRLDGEANNPFYFFADPDEAPVVEFAHLEGVEEPRIETQMGFESDGMKIKVAHDFGAGIVGFRGAVKSTAAG